MAPVADAGPSVRRSKERRRGLEGILDDVGVELLHVNRARGPRQTHALATFQMLHRQHGDAHLRDVLTTILESEGNELALVAPIIKAVSGLHVAHAGWFDRDASTWLTVFDRIDLLALYGFVSANRAAAQPSDAIAAIVHVELVTAFDPGRAQWRADHVRPPAPPPPSLERRLHLSTTMVEVLRRATVDEATGVARLHPATPPVTADALRRRELVEHDSCRLTRSGRAAAAELVER